MTEPSWRIIGDQDEPEVFIPCSGPRSIAVLLDAARWMRGEWTPEERAEMERRAAERDAELLAEQKRDLERHADLLKFSPHPTLTALLEAHGPHPYDLGRGRLGYQCHDCPQDWNDGDQSYQSWPCPTWQLIDKETS